MKLTPGQRITTGDRSTFEIISLAWQTPRHEFFRARRVFWNLRPTDPPLYESDPDESLNVLARVAKEGVEENIDIELDAIARLADLPRLPRPIDVFRHDDPSTSRAVLFLADPGGRRLADHPPAGQAERCRFLWEVYSLIETMHSATGVVVGELTEEDFLIDEWGRWTFLGTEHFRPSDRPEDRDEDLRAWLRLAESLVPELVAVRNLEIREAVRAARDALRPHLPPGLEGVDVSDSRSSQRALPWRRAWATIREAISGRDDA